MKNRYYWALVIAAFIGSTLPVAVFEFYHLIIGLPYVQCSALVSSIFVLIWPIPWIFMMFLLNRYAALVQSINQQVVNTQPV